MQRHIAPDKLINRISAASIGEGSWCSFLEEACSIVPNGQSFLFYHDSKSGAGAFCLNAGMDADSSAAYSHYYSRINPFMPHAAIRPVGLAVQADRMLPREILQRSEYYNDFLLPQEIETGVGVTVVRNDGCNFLFSIMCAELDEQHAEAVRECMQSLVPHLQSAFNRARIGKGPPGPHRTGRCGTLRLGPGGRLHAANTAALEIIDSSLALRIDGSGRLVCSATGITDAIAKALGGWGSAEASVNVAHLTQGSAGMPLRFTVIRSAVDEDSYFRGPECIVLIEDPASRLNEAVEEFGDVNGLTSAERRVVSALADGLAAAEIAEATATSLDTVRSHIKHIFVRTGLRRQVDVVRHVCLLAGISQYAADDLVLGLPAISSHSTPPRHGPFDQ